MASWNTAIINFSAVDWSFTQSTAHHIENPLALASTSLSWLPATVPGTVAQSLRLAKLEKSADFSDSDNLDWWYSCTFHATDNAPENKESSTSI